MSLIFTSWKDYVNKKKTEEVYVTKKMGILTNDSQELLSSHPSSPTSNLAVLSSTSVPHLSSANSASSITSFHSQSSTSTFSPITPQISRRLGIIQLHTKGSLLEMTDKNERYILERIGWYSGPFLDEFLELIENGSKGLLQV